MATNVIVVRAFSIGGVRQEPGSRVSVGDGLAAELISAGKAERAPALPPEPRAEAEPLAEGLRRDRGKHLAPSQAPSAPPPAPMPNQRPRKP